MLHHGTFVVGGLLVVPGKWGQQPASPLRTLCGGSGPCLWNPRWQWWLTPAPAAHVGGPLMPESMCRDRGSYGGPDPLFTCPAAVAPCLFGGPDFFLNSLGCSASHPSALALACCLRAPTVVLSPSLTLGLSLGTQPP